MPGPERTQEVATLVTADMVRDAVVPERTRAGEAVTVPVGTPAQLLPTVTFWVTVPPAPVQVMV